MVVCMLGSAATALSQERATVYFRADVMNPVTIDTTSVIRLVDNVLFYHNDAVILCDTAYRYSDRYMEGVGNVLINKDSTFIYGDRFTYDGETNIAKVYAPIIKMIDKDAILYTYNLEFNTLDNVGIYSGGGTITQQDNLMESDRGEYYADTRDVVFIGNVSMENDEYKIQSDSVGYNMDSEMVTFFEKAYIWNKNDEFLMADRGFYYRNLEKYDFTENAYILTREQELWADSIVYYSNIEEAEMYRNIQILDTVQMAYAFGDKGFYWGGEQYNDTLKLRVLMTENPSVAGYEENGDTTFMRADTLLIFSLPRTMAEQELRAREEAEQDDYYYFPDDLRAEGESRRDSALLVIFPDSLLYPSDEYLLSFGGLDLPEEDIGVREEDPTDQLRKAEEIPDAELAAPEPESRKQRKRREKQEALQARRTAKALQDSLRTAQREEAARLADSIAHAELHHGHDHDHNHDHQHEQTSVTTPQRERPLPPQRQRDTVPAQPLPALTEQMDMDEGVVDSLGRALFPADSLYVLPSPEQEQDSMAYIIHGFRNVKIYRSDLQSVCDSLVAFSIDSTVHMFHDPIMWSDSSQIIAGKIVLFTENEQLSRGLFTGDPIVGQQIDDVRFNQITGREIEAFFVDNEIDRAEVNGNAETYYYMEDEGEIVAFMVSTCGYMDIDFEERKISRIVWIEQPDYIIYPIDMISGDQPTLMDGFSWREDRRPQDRYEVCDRTIRDSFRPFAEAMPEPDFFITRDINEKKRLYTEQGIWTDRSEPVTVDLNEFRNQTINL